MTELAVPRIRPGPKPKYLPAILQVLNEQHGELTDRQIFYRLVAKSILSNIVANYTRLTVVIKKARISGAIPWNRIVDRSKPIYVVNDSDSGDSEEYFEDCRESYEGAEETFQESYESYEVSLWKFQPEYVEVWCEKDALAGPMLQVTRKWRVPLVVCRGYQSITNIYDRLKVYEEIISEGRRITVLYYGDFDPRGENIPDIIVRDFKALGYNLDLVKVALTKQQTVQLNLIPAPCKKTDTMARAWVENHGDNVYELDAIEPNQLLTMVDESIKAHFSEEKHQERDKYEADGKAAIQKLTSEYFGENEE